MENIPYNLENLNFRGHELRDYITACIKGQNDYDMKNIMVAPIILRVIKILPEDQLLPSNIKAPGHQPGALFGHSLNPG